VAAFLDIFAFVSVLLRALTLVFEALTVGGVIFQFAITPQNSESLRRRLSKLLLGSSAMLAVVQLANLAADSAILMASTNLTWTQVKGAGFCISGAFMIVGAGLVGLFALTRSAKIVCPIGCILILGGAVMTSHSMARLDHRVALAALTLTHHVASAAWIGGMPYLLLSLRGAPSPALAAVIIARFSRMAMVSVASLLVAGVALSVLYVGSIGALTGTAYGIMVLSKVFLTALVVMLGSLNRKIVGSVSRRIGASLLPLRRFAEVELGIGVTIILAAASLTSSPPAIDLQADRVNLAEIADRMTPRWPRMQTPLVSELSPATPLGVEPSPVLAASFVPGQTTYVNTLADIAWSEYNHHWAGVVVFAIGILSLVARRMRWARHWPLTFLCLAVFLLVRADSENWPLGPRGFWESFQVAEVAQHRLFVLLIVAFAVFEWRVQANRIRAERAGLVFPMVCAAGGALLLTHSHSLGNVKEEFLAELSHVPLAILAVMAGWSRWLEVRLKPDPPWVGLRQFVPWIWPVCFILIGAILLNYREA